MLKQITVFLENEQGRLAAMCRTLAEAGINMTALTVADTESFGVARILADEPEEAVETLRQADYRAKITEVSAVKIPNVPGGLATLLEGLDDADINVEYAYCFASDKDNVVVVFRVENEAGVTSVVEQLGYQFIEASDI